MVALLVAFPVLAQHARAQAANSDDGKINVKFNPNPKDTQTTVTGTLSGDIARLSSVQAVYVEVVNGSNGDSDVDVVQGPLDAKYSPSTYSFTVTNLKPLAEGQAVHVHVCGAPVPESFTGSTTKDSPIITNLSGSAVPSLMLIRGGGISGADIPQGATIVSVDSATQITISQKAAKDGTSSVLQFTHGPSCSQAGPQNAANGNSAKAALVEIPATGGAIEVISLYDLGRLKTYFSIGAEFQGNNGSLGTTSGFAAMNLDANWLTTGSDMKPFCPAQGDSPAFRGMLREINERRSVVRKLRVNPPDKSAPPKRSADVSPENTVESRKMQLPFQPKECDGRETRILINSYAEAELTQIPLTSSSQSSGGTNPGSTPTAIAEPRAATTQATGSGSNSSSLDVSKAKGAYVELGTYLPILPAAAQWTWRGQDNAFFVAPMAKYIFLEPNTTPNGATTSFNAYRAYAGGVRLGHFRLPSHFYKQNPELLSYVDFTFGKWENFREASGTRGVRFDAKGRYKIPYTILYVGFEANVGPGGSDYRMFAGTRLDISSVLGKLLPTTN
jgi:hypothetical protein